MNPSTIKDERFDWSQFGAPSATFALYMGCDGQRSKVNHSDHADRSPLLVTVCTG